MLFALFERIAVCLLSDMQLSNSQVEVMASIKDESNVEFDTHVFSGSNHLPSKSRYSLIYEEGLLTSE